MQIFARLWNSLLRTLNPRKKQHRWHARALAALRWSVLEALEERTLFSALYWDTSAAAGLQAGSSTWNLTATNWNTAADGSGSRVGWIDGSDAVFVTSGSPTVTISSGVTAHSITFTGTGYDITGGTLTLTGSGAVTANLNDKISAAIAGSAGLNVSGAATLTLSGANTFTGGVTVSSGTLKVSGLGTLGDTSNGLTIAGGTLDLNGTTQSVDALNGTSGTILNNATGTTGTLVAGASGGGGTFNGVIINHGAGTGVVALTKAGAGTLILSSNNTYSGTTTISDGVLQIGNGATLGTIGSGAIVDNAALSVNRNNTDTIANAISGTGALIQTGTGTTTLTGANTYSGMTTILAGVLQIGSGGTSGSVGNGDVLDNGGLAIKRSDAYTLANDISGSGSVTLGSTGTILLSGANTASGGTIINTGRVQLAAPGIFSATAALTVNTGAILDMSGTSQTVDGFSGTGGTILNDATGTSVRLTVGAADGGGTFSGILADNDAGTGTLAFTKAGAGTVTLKGANTYSGLTTIDAGTLKIGNGSTGSSLGTGSVVDNGTLAFNRSDTYTIDNLISGTGGIVQLASTAIILTAANSYTGGTVLSLGTVKASGAGTWGASSGGVTLTTGTTLDLNGTNQTVGSLVGDGGKIVNNATGTSATLTLGANDGDGSYSGQITDHSVGTGILAIAKTGTGTLIVLGDNNYSGGTTISRGVLQVGADSAFGAASGDIFFTGNATVRASANVTLNAQRTITINAGVTATFDPQAVILKIAGNITGGGAITRTDTGTLTLTGVNSLTGGPTGVLDTAAASWSGMELLGWALDVRSPSTATEVDIYDGSTLIATTEASFDRPDLASVYTYTNHGFSYALDAASLGWAVNSVHSISVYTSGVGNVPQLIGQQTVKAGASDPFGNLDSATVNGVTGWAYDNEGSGSPVSVTMYVNGVATSTTGSADNQRDDLVMFGSSDRAHGYSITATSSNALSQIAPGTTATVAIGAQTIGLGNSDFLTSLSQGWASPTLTSVNMLSVTNHAPTGTVDAATPELITGSAIDSDTGPNPYAPDGSGQIYVDLYLDGEETHIARTLTQGANHTFSVDIASLDLSGDSHTWQVTFEDSTAYSNGSPTEVAGATGTISESSPYVVSISRASTNPSNAMTVDYSVVFNKDVLGVDSSDFQTASGSISGASITGVSGSGTDYVVSVGTGTGAIAGTLGLNLVDDDSISSAADGLKLGGDGTGNGNFTGDSYDIDRVIDTTPPAVDISSPSAGSMLTNNTPIITGIAGITPGDGNVVAINIYSGNSAIGTPYQTLNATIDAVTGAYSAVVPTDIPLADGNYIIQATQADAAENVGKSASIKFTVDTAAPHVNSMTFQSGTSSPTNALNIGYTVIFNEAVTGVDVTDFSLATSGITGASILAVTGSGTDYNVVVSTGEGDGSLQLNLVDDNSIKDMVGNLLSGATSDDGGYSGPPAVIEKDSLSHRYSANVNSDLDVPDAEGLLAGIAGVDGSTVSLVTAPGHGSVTVQSDGSFQYLSGTEGIDSFTYQITTPDNQILLGTAVVDVVSAEAPAINDLTFVLHRGAQLTAGSVDSGVLGTATDPNGLPLTAVLVNDVQHGNLVLNSDGTFVYTPEAGFVGEDAFTYAGSDGAQSSDPARVALEVINTPPTVTQRDFTIKANSPLSLDASQGLLAGAQDFDGDPLSIVQVSNPSHGTISYESDGSFVYIPDAAYIGADQISFEVGDTTVGAAEVWGAIDITVADQAPTAGNISYTTDQNSTLGVNSQDGLLTAAADGDNDTLVVLSNSSPFSTQHGTAILNTDGSFTYIPTAGFVGLDQFSYTVSDGSINSNSALISINVVGPNLEPVGDSYAVQPGVELAVSQADGVLANDADDAPTDSLVVLQDSSPTHGTLNLQADGSFTYMPDSGFSGTDQFTYHLVRGDLVSNLAIVTLTMASEAPVQSALVYAVTHDHVLTIDPTAGILAGIYSPSGSAVSVSVASAPAHGEVALSSDGSFIYTPAVHFIGRESFTVIASDGATHSAPITVAINVADAAPVTSDYTYQLIENTAFNSGSDILLSGGDSDGDELSASLTSQANHGTAAIAADGSFSYIPTVGFVGTDSFTYAATDGVLSTSGAVTVVVAASLAPPTVTPPAYSVSENGTLTASFNGVLAGASDPQQLPTKAVLVSSPSHGTLLSFDSSGAFIYTPISGFTGSDQFTFTVDDSSGQISDPIIASIDVQTTTPSAHDQNLSMPENTAVTISAATGVLSDSSNPGGGPLAATLYAGASHGTVTLQSDGGYTYSPDSNFIGADSFAYTVSNDLNTSAVAYVHFNVTDDAVITNGLSYQFYHDQPLSASARLGVLRNDWTLDGSALTAVLVDSPASGNLTLNGDGSFVYLPAEHFVGDVSFTYEAQSGTAGVSDPVTVSLSILPSSLVVAQDQYTLPHDQNFDISDAHQGLFANDYDSNGGSLSAPESLESITTNQGGLLVVHGDGTFTYDPPDHFIGSDYAFYTVTNGIDDVSGRVDFTVTDNQPIAPTQSLRVHHDPAAPLSGNLLTGAHDADGEPLTITLGTDAVHGTFDFNPENGSFTYMPDAGYVGTDNVAVNLSDGAASSSETLNIDVWNSAPSLDAQTYSVQAGSTTPVAGNLLDAVSNPDDDTLTVTPYGMVAGEGGSYATAHGTLTLGTDGEFSYTPDPQFAGADSFYVVVSDGAQQTPPVAVTIQVMDLTPFAPNQFFLAASPGNLLAEAWGSNSPTQLKANLASNSTTSNGGTVSVDVDGTFHYTPRMGFIGLDSFTYTVTDGITTSSPGQVTIDVDKAAPDLTDDSFSGDMGQPITGNILANDDHATVDNPQRNLAVTSVNGNPVTGTGDNDFTLEHGQLTINAAGAMTFVPTSGFYGTQQFSYTAANGWLTGQAVNVTIMVNQGVIVAQEAVLTTSVGTTINGNLLDSVIQVDDVAKLASIADVDISTDPDDPGVFPISIYTNDQKAGEITDAKSDGSFTFMPAAHFTGTATFDYEADGEQSSSSSVTIYVTSEIPTADSQSFNGAQGDSITIPYANLQVNDGNAGEYISRYNIVVAPNQGMLSPSSGGVGWIYTPRAGFFGADTFSYEVTDSLGLTSAPAVVTLDVEAAGQTVTAAGADLTVEENSTLSIDLLDYVNSAYRAINGDDLTFSISSPPTCGAALVTGSTLTYTPNTNFHSNYFPGSGPGTGWQDSDSLIYKVADSKGVTSTGTLQILVTPLSLAPVAFDVHFSGNQDTTISYTLPTPSDRTGQPDSLYYADILSQPVHGFAYVSGSSLNYVPDPGYSGSDSFQYRIYDGQWNSADATANVTIDQAAYTPVTAPTNLNASYTLHDGDDAFFVAGGHAYEIRVRTDNQDALIAISFQNDEVYATGEGGNFYSLSVFDQRLDGAPANSTLHWSGDAASVVLSSNGNIADVDVTGTLYVNARGNLGRIQAGTLDTAIAGGSIEGVVATQGIGAVIAGRSILGSIQAKGGDIGVIQAFKSIDGDEIIASGAIGEIDVTGEINANIHAGTTIGKILSINGNVNGDVWAGGKIGGFSNPINPYGIQAGGDILGDITSGDEIILVSAGRDLIGDVTAQQKLDLLRIGRNMAVLSHVKAWNLGPVSVGNQLDGFITATGGNIVGVTATFLDGNISSASDIGYVNGGTANRDGGIDDAKISATGAIASITSTAVPGRGGDISNSTINAGIGGIGTINSDGSLQAVVVTSSGAITSISAGLSGKKNTPGDIDGKIVSLNGAIGEVSASGSISGTISAALTLGGGFGVFAGGDINAQISAGQSIDQVKSSQGSVGGSITSANGSIISGIFAAENITAVINAYLNIGIVAPEFNNITGIHAGWDVTGNITATVGSIAAIEAGTLGGGNITGSITAGKDIGAIEAHGGSAVDTSKLPSAGPVPWQDGISQVTSAFTGDLPAAPILARLPGPPVNSYGAITGQQIVASGNIVSITADGGTINDTVSVGKNLGQVWALGNISGNVSSGQGGITVYSWGDISGNLTAKGDITAGAYGTLSGTVTTNTGDLTASAWNKLSGDLSSAGNVYAWAANELSSNITSGGFVQQISWGTLSGNVNYTGNIVNALNAPWGAVAEAIGDYSGSFIGAINKTLSQLVLGWSNVQVTEPPEPDEANENVAGIVFIFARKDLTMNQGFLDAANGATFLTEGNFSAGMGLNVYSNNVRISALKNVTGNVAALSRNGSTTLLSVSGEDIQGTFDATQVVIDASKDANITTSTYPSSHGYILPQDVAVNAGGKVSGNISCSGLAKIEADGDMSAEINGNRGVVVTTWGNISAPITSTSGAVVVYASGSIGTSARIKGHTFVTVDAWGTIGSSISTTGDADVAGGYVQIFAAGAISDGLILADGEVSIEAWGNVSDSVAAGYNSTSGTEFTASITATGNVTGAVSSSGNVNISATGDVSASITATAGYASISAGGKLSGSVTAQRDIGILAGIVTSGAAGTITSSQGALAVQSLAAISGYTFRAGNSVDLEAGADIHADLILSGTNGQVTVNALGEIPELTVAAAGAAVNVNSGGNLVITVSNASGAAAGSAFINADGNVSGVITTTGKISLFAHGTLGGDGSPFTATSTMPGGNIDVFSDGDMDATLSAGDELSAGSMGSITGSFTSGTASNYLTGTAAINANGAINNANVVAATDATVISGAAITNATVKALGGAGAVTAQGAISALNLTTAGISSVTALGGDIGGLLDLDTQGLRSSIVVNEVIASGDINAVVTSGGDADVETQGKLLQSLTATYDASVEAVGDIDADVNAGVTGAASVSGNAIAGDVTAGTSAAVFAGATVSGNVTAEAGSATVNAQGEISGSVSGDTQAIVNSLDAVSGSVTSAAGGVEVSAGTTLSGNVLAHDTVQATAIGDISGSITSSNLDAVVNTFGKLTSAVLANRDATVSATGDITSNVEGTTGRVTLETLGKLTGGTVTAGSYATVSVLGDVEDPVIAGIDATVSSLNGKIEGDVTATTGALALSSAGDMEGTMTAGTTAAVMAGANGDMTVDGGQSVQVTVFGIAKLTVTAGNAASIVAGDTLTANVQSGGEMTVSAIGAANLTLSSGGNLQVTAATSLTGSGVSTSGDISITSGGAMAMNLTADTVEQQDIQVMALDDLSGSTIHAMENANVTVGGSAAADDIRGDNSVVVITGGSYEGSLESAEGSVNLLAGTNATLTGVSAGTDAVVTAVGNLSATAGTIEADRNLTVFAGGILDADISAGANASVSGFQTVSGSFTAGNDLTVKAIGLLSATMDAGLDLTISAYGGIDASTQGTAGRDIASVMSTGTLAGTFEAGRSVVSVKGYQDITASFTAGMHSESAYSADSTFGVINNVEAWGDISGDLTASASIGQVVSGGEISGTSNAPTVLVQTANAKNIFGDYPPMPDTSLAGADAGLAGLANAIRQAVAQLSALAGQMATGKTASAASLAQQVAVVMASAAQGKLDAQANLAASKLAIAKAITQTASLVQKAMTSSSNQLKLSLANLSANDQLLYGLFHDALQATQTAINNASSRLAMAEQLEQSSESDRRSQQSQDYTTEQERLAIAAVTRKADWLKDAAQVVSKVQDAINTAKAHRDLETIIAIANLVSLVAAVTGFEPIAAVAFEIGRAASLENAALYLSEGQYLSAGENLLMGLMPNPAGGEGFSVVGAMEGETTGLAETGAETLAEGSAGESAFVSSEEQAVAAAEGQGEEVVQGTCGKPMGCFTGDTQVIVGVNADGTYQMESIDQVQVGQTVLTRNENDPDGPLEERTVTDVEVHTVTSLREVTVELADGSTETIETTDSHPFYVQGVGFVSAEDLIQGMILSTPDGKTETVVSTSVSAKPDGVQVYNLTVDGDHTYFVMPQTDSIGQLDLDAVWVHNTCADAAELKRNLIDAGEDEEKIAAHIVPTGDFSSRSVEVQGYIKFSKGVLEDADIGLNDAENGFFTESATHIGTHTDEYFEGLAGALGSARNVDEVLSVLKGIKNSLMGL